MFFLHFQHWHQSVHGLHHRRGVARHAGLQQAAFVGGKDQGGDALGTVAFVASLHKGIGHAATQVGEAGFQRVADFDVVRSGLERHGGQRAAQFELAVVQATQRAQDPRLQRGQHVGFALHVRVELVEQEAEGGFDGGHGQLVFTAGEMVVHHAFRRLGRGQDLAQACAVQAAMLQRRDHGVDQALAGGQLGVHAVYSIDRSVQCQELPAHPVSTLLAPW